MTQIIHSYDSHGQRRARPGARAAATERRLIEGTLETLRRDGLQATSSRAIATTAGVNLAGITYHFGSKDELVATALLHAFRTWIDPALDVLRTEGDPEMRTMAAIQALQISFERARDLLPVYLEALVQASRTGTLRRGVEAALTELRALVAAQIADMVAAGSLPEWVHPRSMATLLLAAADGVALHAAIDPDGVDAVAVGTQAVGLLLAARR
jgi:AcrR family transcriptional regulator